MLIEELQRFIKAKREMAIKLSAKALLAEDFVASKSFANGMFDVLHGLDILLSQQKALTDNYGTLEAQDDED